jgi:DNA-directed RNA polymerase subunit RPC12/RpoP
LNENDERNEELRRQENHLAPLGDYFLAHPSLSPLEFDYATAHGLTLFTVEPSLDFEGMEKTADRILETLPALKRIFQKPIIALTDTDDVLPVETVHIINQGTLLHLQNHAENVEDITAKGLKPRKLLTRIYEDDYSLYENLVFCEAIDEILSFARRGMASLKDLIYAKEVLELNLLERTNHVNYFLTIGKLHTGYRRDFEAYYPRAKALYAELDEIENALSSRLHRPVYQKNKIRPQKLPLKKTNIFLMQKDYHALYRLSKALRGIEEKKKGEVLPDFDEAKAQSDYASFILALSIFAITSFSFESEDNTPYDFAHLDAHFHNDGWKLTLTLEADASLLFTLEKSRTIRFHIQPCLDKKSLQKPLVSSETDTFYDASPFEEDAAFGKILYLSVENLDSFRRIQQCLFKAMIEADETHETCPYCGEKMSYDSAKNQWRCPRCQNIIGTAICPDDKMSFIYTSIQLKKKKHLNPEDYSTSSRWIYERKLEALLNFRNITPINESGEILCPRCGKKPI